MSLLEHPRQVSVSEATQRGVAGIINDATVNDIVLTRRNKPVAALVGIERVRLLEEKLEDLRDLALAVARASTGGEQLISFDDVLTAFGLTEADLDAADDLD